MRRFREPSASLGMLALTGFGLVGLVWLYRVIHAVLAGPGCFSYITTLSGTRLCAAGYTGWSEPWASLGAAAILWLLASTAEDLLHN